MKLKDKIALVTGSSRGVGRAVALGFATEMVFFVALAVIFGLGQGSTHPILNAMNVETVEPAHRGMAIALFMVTMELGLAFGALSLGFVAEGSGYNAVFPVAALILVAGIICMVAVRMLAMRRNP